MSLLAMAAKSGVIRAKNRNDFLIIQLILNEKLLKVVQMKTVHLEKFGWKERGVHYLLLEEAIYMVELGVAAVVVVENVNSNQGTLSLSQLFGLLPVFGLSVFQYAAFRILVRENHLLRRTSGEKAKLYEYDVYSILPGVGPVVDDKVHKCRLFISRPDRKPSDELRQLAYDSHVPVMLAIGSATSVRFERLPVQSSGSISLVEIVNNTQLMQNDEPED
ncbi:hypothetical protein M3Y95_00788300 [Aphelenchoides besseyi]|nr:hypothetical protein M3Y95_00788300 [Aphelenchoides besseyi]